MSAESPRLLARSPAEPGSLAHGLVTGDEETSTLLPDGILMVGDEGIGRGGLPARASRGRLSIDALRASNAEARERAEAALEGDGVFVTTGQQPVLFLGPLYVLYKALTAVEIAEALHESGTPAVALFWVAGDDHDWAEVGRTRLLDRSNRLRELRVGPPDGRAGRAVGPSPLPDGVSERIEQITQALPSSEFVDGYLGLLRDAWTPGRAFSDAFGRTLQSLFADRCLTWVDAASPAVRRAEAPLFERVVEEADEVMERLARGTGRVREAGWSPQVAPREAGLPLFVDTAEGRRRLFRTSGAFRVGREGGEVSGSEIAGELDARPERFSPDVALRPPTASWLLPTGVTVLGPAELAYWTQLPELFGWADVPLPRLRLRDGWTVLESKVGKVLDKLDVGPEDFRDGGRSLARRVRDGGRPEPVEEALSEARAGFGRALAGVEEAVGREMPGIRSAVGAARHQAFRVLEELATAVDDRVEEQHEVVLAQIRKAARHLWPEGEPQERVLTPFYYLARYGPAFLELLARRTRERARPEDGE